MPSHLKVSSVIANDNGIAMSVMKVVRKLSRNRKMTSVTITAPSTMALFRLPMALVMKSACRKRTTASTPLGMVG